jgi:hypothetical protein
MLENESKGRGTMLGVMAYLFVPGERRKQAATHFQKAGFEALKGVGALARPSEKSAEMQTERRERIEIE